MQQAINLLSEIARGAILVALLGLDHGLVVFAVQER
jgi:hypothetical protein